MKSLAACALVLSLVATQTEDISVSLWVRVPQKEKPYVLLTAHKPVKEATLNLRRSDGKSLVLKSGRLKQGQEKKVFLDQPLGTFTYEGTLHALFTDDTSGTMPLRFEAAVLTPPNIQVDDNDVHLDDHRVEVTMDHPVRKVQFRVTGDNGEIIDEGEANFSGEPAGTKLPLVWKPGQAKILRIDVIGHDMDGMFSPTFSLFPWSLDIPHQDVNFASGQSVIPVEEQPKVQSALEDIQTAISRYGKVVDIKLFVTGHTDSVGTAEHNRALSQARAQSIAKAFRKGGIKVPIHFRGQGEDQLKVATPDETDNIENRRAEYTLAVEEMGGGWTLLR